MKVLGNGTEQILSTNMEQHAMTVDAENMAHIQQLLGGIYSNPILAVIREYSANALDSHRDAGVDEPIVVTLPTVLSPQFVVQDFGLGLSKDEIIEIYASYGASTKRDTNDMIGGFGIGSKSALQESIAQQFTVVGIKDGRKVSVLFSLSSSGGNVTVLGESDTDERNGVTVSIPVSGDFANWKKEATFLFSYWGADEVKVRGLDPEETIVPIKDSMTEVAEGVFIREDSRARIHNSLITVEMGNIPYPINSGAYSELTDGRYSYNNGLENALRNVNYCTVISVPIGTLEIAPDREGVMLNERNRAVASELFDNAWQAIKDWANERLESAENKLEATRRYFEHATFFENIFGDEKPSYKGEALSIRPDPKASVMRACNSRYRSSLSYQDVIGYGYRHLNDVTIVMIDTEDAVLEGDDNYKTGGRWATPKAVTGEYLLLNKGRVKNNARHFMEARGLQDVIFTTKQEAGEDLAFLIHDPITITLTDYCKEAAAWRKKLKLEATGGVSGAPAKASTGFTYYTSAGDLTVAEIAEYDHVAFIQSDRYQSARSKVAGFLPYLNDEDKKYLIILLSVTQKPEAMHKRLAKQGITAEELPERALWDTDFYRKVLADAVAGATENERMLVESGFASGWYRDENRVFYDLVTKVNEAGVDAPMWNGLISNLPDFDSTDRTALSAAEKLKQLIDYAPSGVACYTPLPNGYLALRDLYSPIAAAANSPIETEDVVTLIEALDMLYTSRLAQWEGSAS